MNARIKVYVHIHKILDDSSSNCQLSTQREVGHCLHVLSEIFIAKSALRNKGKYTNAVILEKYETWSKSQTCHQIRRMCVASIEKDGESTLPRVLAVGRNSDDIEFR